MMNLGGNIKKARKAAGMTQKELAEQLHVYQKDISRWESNTLTPNALTLGKICEILHASADDILELKKNKTEVVDRLPADWYDPSENAEWESYLK